MFLSIRTVAPIALSLVLLSLTSCSSASKDGKTTFSHTIDSTDIKHVEVATVSVQTLPDLSLIHIFIIPITDGNKVYNIPCDLAEADRTEGKSIVKEFHKTIMLYTLDDAWKEHLREMDELRNSCLLYTSPEQKGQVIDCIRTGYMLHDKVLRHAHVVVGN